MIPPRRRLAWLALLAIPTLAIPAHRFTRSEELPNSPASEPEPVFPAEERAPLALLNVGTDWSSRPPMAFSPDSAWLYYVSENQLVSHNLHGEDALRVPLDERHPSLALTADLQLFRVSESNPENPLLIRQ